MSHTVSDTRLVRVRFDGERGMGTSHTTTTINHLHLVLSSAANSIQTFSLLTYSLFRAALSLTRPITTKHDSALSLTRRLDNHIDELSENPPNSRSSPRLRERERLHYAGWPFTAGQDTRSHSRDTLQSRGRNLRETDLSAQCRAESRATRAKDTAQLYLLQVKNHLTSPA